MRRIRVSIPVDTLAHRIERLAAFAGFVAALIATSFALPDTVSYVVGNQLRPAPVSERLLLVEFDDLYAATRDPAQLRADVLAVARRVRAAAPEVVALDASVMPATAADGERVADSLQFGQVGGCVVLPARVVENSGVTTVIRPAPRPGMASGFVLQPGAQVARDAGLHARLRRVVQQGYGRVEGVDAFADAVAQGCAASGTGWTSAQRIRYRGPLTSESGFGRVSAADVLAGEIPDEWLAGRVVLIGRNLSLPDAEEPLYSTPYGLRGSLMVQANAVNARLGGVWWAGAPGWGGALVAVLLLCICAPVFIGGFSPWAPFLGAVLLLAAHAGFVAAGYILPAAFTFRIWFWASVFTYLLAPRGRRYRWASMPVPEDEAASSEDTKPAEARASAVPAEAGIQRLPEAATRVPIASFERVTGDARVTQ